jgi:hypothetical protein
MTKQTKRIVTLQSGALAVETDGRAVLAESKELANGKFVFVPRVPGRKGPRKQHTTALEALSTPLRW